MSWISQVEQSAFIGEQMLEVAKRFVIGWLLDQKRSRYNIKVLKRGPFVQSILCSFTSFKYSQVLTAIVTVW